MKLQRLLSFAVVAALSLGSTTMMTSCGKDPVDPPVDPQPEAKVLTGDITSDKTLEGGPWTLKGYVYVKEGATLTIPAGTVIKSDLTDKGALIVERGGKLMAEGTASSPIVFTSGQPKGQRRPGDWGGIILLGKAPTNRSTEPIIEGGVDRKYGGTDPNDNSGVLKYVRIEFAGIAASPGSEINGLTLGGVGAGTTIDYVMVSYGNDDAYEFFGGTVNAKHVVAFATLDDDFDFDFGYRGKLQYGLSVKHPQYADIGDASNGIECDNDGTGTTATPYTHPYISNFTFVGPNGRANTQANHNFANRWRRATEFTIRNSILIGHQKGGFSMESSATANGFLNGSNEFKNNLVHAITKPFIGVSGTVTDSAVQAICINTHGCIKLDSANAAMLSNPWSLTAPAFLPQGSSPALSGASFSGMDAWFEQTGAFRGAFGTTDWTTGWTNFDPNNTDY
ncbi:MAG: hypothetical protein JNL72_00730 [Flavipsychrobacter sp.]|nr:hypothetical protein [Flavipsychrobacter sp.]